MGNLGLPPIGVPNIDSWKNVSNIRMLSETQFEIIKKYILEFQSSLDNEYDVGIMMEGLGFSGVMEVNEISYEEPVLMIFKGTVNGKKSTLIQHLNQLNFLLTTVPKQPEKPNREIGFTAHWAAE